jgi:acyl dehydratase
MVIPLITYSAKSGGHEAQEGTDGMELDFAEISGALGRSFGPSDWLTVDQSMINSFSELTGDDAWYHVDIARASTELPQGKSIAHGYLTLALVPALSNQVLRIRYRTRALNYGADRVRFPSPVQVGDRIRLRTKPTLLAPHSLGTLLHLEHVVEREHGERPVLALVRLSLVMDEFLTPSGG